MTFFNASPIVYCINTRGLSYRLIIIVLQGTIIKPTTFLDKSNRYINLNYLVNYREQKLLPQPLHSQA